MDESRKAPAAGLLRRRTAEGAVAALFVLAGAIVLYDSMRLGARWADEGPQPGYFPFYIGALLCLSGAVNLVRALFAASGLDAPFVGASQLRQVLAVLVPLAIYAALLGWAGIYVTSFLLIVYFMRALGAEPWWKALAVGAGTSAALYALFELWFLIPLPKGPLEVWLRLA